MRLIKKISINIKLLNIVNESNKSIDIRNYKKKSGPLGSNQGGLYVDKYGQEIYVKKTKDKLRAENEVLASILYRYLDVPSSTVMFANNDDGNEYICAKYIHDNGKEFKYQINNQEYINKLQKNFIIDCWLCNWDVIGTEFNNIIIDVNNEPFRIDLGGALLFRARGEAKGNLFELSVPELKTMRDPVINQYCYKVFSNISEENISYAVNKLRKISDQEIHYIVNHTISDKLQAKQIIEKLISRKKFILNEFNLGG
jgi:hypothetical protein